MADIFVSYSRTDKARVAPLVSALEAQGWSLWWDPEITPGDEFDALIGAELESARAVVVVGARLGRPALVKGEARRRRPRCAGAGALRECAPADRRTRDSHDRLDDWAGKRDSAAFLGLCTALETKLKRSVRKSRGADAEGQAPRRHDLRAAFRQYER